MTLDSQFCLLHLWLPRALQSKADGVLTVCVGVAQGRYKQSLYKAYKRTIEEGRFRMVVVDAPNVAVEDFKDYWATGQARPIVYCRWISVKVFKIKP